MRWSPCEEGSLPCEGGVMLPQAKGPPEGRRGAGTGPAFMLSGEHSPADTLISDSASRTGSESIYAALSCVLWAFVQPWDLCSSAVLSGSVPSETCQRGGAECGGRVQRGSGPRPVGSSLPPSAPWPGRPAV